MTAGIVHDLDSLNIGTIEPSGKVRAYWRFYSHQGFKVFLNKQRSLLANHKVVALGEVPLWELTIQEYDDLLKIPWRKRAVHLKVLAKEAEIRRVKEAARNIKQMENDLRDLKRELGRM